MVFVVPFLLTSFVLGPEFPSLIGGLIGLPIVIVAARRNFLTPREIWTFEHEDTWPASWKGKLQIETAERPVIPLWKAWLPYGLIALILVITRVPELGVRQFLTGMEINVTDILSVEGLTYSMRPAYIPGIIPFALMAVIIQAVTRLTWREARSIWGNTGRQLSGATIALLFGVALVQVMLKTEANPQGLSSMMKMMAEAVAAASGKIYVFISPLVGVLGSFMTGSNTVSNILFSSFQYDTAMILGLPAVYIVVLQVVGGAIGNMVCVNNIVAVSATVGLEGVEGRLIRSNIGPCLLYSILAAVFIRLVI
jgi:lactate permease